MLDSACRRTKEKINEEQKKAIAVKLRFPTEQEASIICNIHYPRNLPTT